MITFTIEYAITVRATGAHRVDKESNLSQLRLAERLIQLVSDSEYVRVVYSVTTQK